MIDKKTRETWREAAEFHHTLVYLGEHLDYVTQILETSWPRIKNLKTGIRIPECLLIHVDRFQDLTPDLSAAQRLVVGFIRDPGPKWDEAARRIMLLLESYHGTTLHSTPGRAKVKAENILTNTKHHYLRSASASTMTLEADNSTTIVWGAGPSLDQTLEAVLHDPGMLEQVQKATNLVCDTSYPAWAKYMPFDPDAIGIMDMGKLKAGLIAGTENIPLVAHTQANPDMVAEHDKLILGFEKMNLGGLLPDCWCPHSIQNVGHLLYRFAKDVLRSKQTILVGMDLVVGHSEEAGKQLPALAKGTLDAVCRDGVTRKTRPSWLGTQLRWGKLIYEACGETINTCETGLEFGDYKPIHEALASIHPKTGPLQFNPGMFVTLDPVTEAFDFSGIKGTSIRINPHILGLIDVHMQFKGLLAYNEMLNYTKTLKKDALEAQITKYKVDQMQILAETLEVLHGLWSSDTSRTQETPD